MSSVGETWTCASAFAEASGPCVEERSVEEARRREDDLRTEEGATLKTIQTDIN